MTTKSFSVSGMTCASCQAHISDKVSKLDGVKSADVNLLAERMAVEYDERLLSDADIIGAVKSIGYGASLSEPDSSNAAAPSLRSERDKRREKAALEAASMRKRLISSVIILLPLMYISMGHMLGLPMPPIFHGQENALIAALTQLVLTVPVVLVNRRFYTSGFRALVGGSPNMDSLIAVGSSSALIYGIFVIYMMAYRLGRGDIAAAAEYSHSLYFESCAMILTLVTVGKYLESRSKSKTTDALDRLIELAPSTATVIRDGIETEIPSESIMRGDTVVLRSGQNVPCDGIVTFGSAYIDEAAVTGESVPAEKSVGDRVISATSVKSGHLRFEATNVGVDTTIAKIIRLVDEAGSSKAPVARLADKVSGVFVPIVIGIAVITAAVWLIFGGGFEAALSNAIAVLVISCPCALGLATPVAIMAGTGRAAEMGILIKSAAALEQLHGIDTVALDKTGTVTEGKPSVTDIVTLDRSLDNDTLLSMCAALEIGSEHPLGQAVVELAEAKGLDIPAATDFTAFAGMGVSAEIDGERWLSGNAALLDKNEIVLSDEAAKLRDSLSDEGKTPLIFTRNGKEAGIIAVADTIRPDSLDAITRFKRDKIKVVMLTGDNKRTAEAVRAKLGIDEVFSGVLPDGKDERIKTLQESGRKVAMIGDGINDAPALTRADVGIAIGAGTDIAIDSADIVLIKSSLSDAVRAVELSRAVMRNIKQNLFWAFFYNILGIPIAAGVLYLPFGITLSPMIAAAAMSLSSVTVVSNALRLRSFNRSNRNHNNTGEKSMKKIIMIDGMMCEHCVAHVKKALEALDEVETVEVELKKKRATVTSSVEIADEKLNKAISDAGYTPKSIKTA